MAPLAITAYTLASALGRGYADHRDALLAHRSGLRPCDLPWIEIDTHIGRAAGIEDNPVRADLSIFDCRNNRLAQMALEADGFERAVGRCRDRYGSHRVAVILGTSTSGIRESEIAFEARSPQDGSLPREYDYNHTHDYASLSRFVRAYLGLHGPAYTVSTACSSSTKSFADAAQLIRAGICDAAVVGGADSLCRMTLLGFTSLELVSTEPCRPFDIDRAGLSIGESAGFALLERTAPDSDAVMLLGYGESCDAYHMSSPHPEGLGASQAMTAALETAGLAPADIDYINLHGTGTPINDQVEDLAVARLFGEGVPCSSTKGWTGHTLGSAGITETVLCCICLREGLVPANLNLRARDPAFRANIVDRSSKRRLTRVMNNSFGFGGNNCSLVLGLPR
jgi:3-oxoacyl-[acyl-carrier-protein] synthase-1